MITLDKEQEMALLRKVFAYTRADGGEFQTMAVAIMPNGERGVIAAPGIKDLDLLAPTLAECGADQALIARDAWFNILPVDGPQPDDYLRPSEDPLAAEVLTVIWASATQVESYMFPYIMVDGQVEWKTDDEGWGLAPVTVGVKGLDVLQASLRR